LAFNPDAGSSSRRLLLESLFDVTLPLNRPVPEITPGLHITNPYHGLRVTRRAALPVTRHITGCRMPWFTGAPFRSFVASGVKRRSVTYGFMHGGMPIALLPLRFTRLLRPPPAHRTKPLVEGWRRFGIGRVPDCIVGAPAECPSVSPGNGVPGAFEIGDAVEEAQRLAAAAVYASPP
jgi:hypothetical protein